MNYIKTHVIVLISIFVTFCINLDSIKQPTQDTASVRFFISTFEILDFLGDFLSKYSNEERLMSPSTRLNEFKEPRCFLMTQFLAYFTFYMACPYATRARKAYRYLKKILHSWITNDKGINCFGEICWATDPSFR